MKINEIYASIQGESSYAGLPCTFIRTSGCPLRCRWCDTAYAFEAGEEMSLAEIVAAVNDKGVNLVELTGGEPLAQKDSWELLTLLAADGYQTMVETGGSEPVAGLPPSTHIVMDLKCPDSQMSDRNRMENLDALKSSDEIKFVLASRRDYEWARDLIRRERLEGRFGLLLSVAWGLQKADEVVAWMLADGLQARFQLQMHKFIWHPRTKGV